jgi:hypothetical protein
VLQLATPVHVMQVLNTLLEAYGNQQADRYGCYVNDEAPPGTNRLVGSVRLEDGHGYSC